jgi:hypothetical protein
LYSGVIGGRLILAAIESIANCATLWKDQGNFTIEHAIKAQRGSRDRYTLSLTSALHRG